MFIQVNNNFQCVTLSHKNVRKLIKMITKLILTNNAHQESGIFRFSSEAHDSDRISAIKRG